MDFYGLVGFGFLGFELRCLLRRIVVFCVLVYLLRFGTLCNVGSLIVVLGLVLDLCRLMRWGGV